MRDLISYIYIDIYIYIYLRDWIGSIYAPPNQKSWIRLCLLSYNFTLRSHNCRGEQEPKLGQVHAKSIESIVGRAKSIESSRGRRVDEVDRVDRRASQVDRSPRLDRLRGIRPESGPPWLNLEHLSVSFHHMEWSSPSVRSIILSGSLSSSFSRLKTCLFFQC